MKNKNEYDQAIELIETLEELAIIDIEQKHKNKQNKKKA